MKVLFCLFSILLGNAAFAALECKSADGVLKVFLYGKYIFVQSNSAEKPKGYAIGASSVNTSGYQYYIALTPGGPILDLIDFNKDFASGRSKYIGGQIRLGQDDYPVKLICTISDHSMTVERQMRSFFQK